MSLSREKSIRLAVACAAVFLVSILLQWMLMNLRLVDYDEGLTLYGAWRVGHGEFPYRDFWTLYGPASFYGLQGLFHVFGESAGTGRLFDVLSRSLIVLLVFLLSRRFADPRVAFGAAMASCFFLIAAQSYGAPIFPALACSLLAILFASRALERRDARAWAFAGAAIGATAVIRLDLGVYAAIVSCVGIFGAYLSGYSSRSMTVRWLACAACAGTCVVAPVAAYIAIHVPIADMYEDLVRIPLVVYPKYRGLPFPQWQDLLTPFMERQPGPRARFIVYIPFVIASIVIVLAARSFRNFRSQPATDGARLRLILETMLVAQLLLVILKGFIRVSVLHMTPALVVSMILAASLTARLGANRLRILATVLLAMLGAKVAITSDAVSYPLDRVTTLWGSLRRGTVSFCEPSPIARAGCFRTDASQEKVVASVERRTRPGDRIYIGPARHDKVFANEVDLYFLSDRAAATKWHDVHPGVQTTLSVQQAMLRDFSSTPPAVIVLSRVWENESEPNASAVSSGVTLLDEWIRAHYAPVDVFGDYAVLEPIRANR